MPEADRPKDRPTIFLESLLGDKRTVRTLLTQSEEKELILDKASNELVDFDGTEARSLVRALLNGLSRDDEQWDQDKRDCALAVLEVVDLGKIRKDRLAQDYLEAISAQNENSDPYGTISALLEAGTIVGTCLPPGAETRERVNLAWNNISGKFEGDDRKYIDATKRDVVAKIPLQAEELLGNPEIRLGWREHPNFDSNFDPGIGELHEAYLATTQSQKTFKIALWEHTPNFRALCATHGIELEKFWNLSDPDQITDSLVSLEEAEMTAVRPYFAKALQREIGLRLDGLTTEQARFLADEVILAAHSARKDILGGAGDFMEIVGKFRNLLEESRVKPAKAQRVLRAQIAHFFKENGVVFDGSLEELKDALDNSTLLAEIERGFNDRHADRRKMAGQLSDVFNLDTQSLDYSLISRRREDLFLGDLTGDCTAYHLHTGVNAWTVPIWLSNPGFNFFRINDGGHLVAKLGVVLADTGEKPALVVDSFEVGQGIEDYDTAVNKIRGGLRFLKQWSERIGLADVYVNTISNSSGAVDLLKDSVKVVPQISELYVLGGLQGLSELRAGLIGNEVAESIYLQSRESDLDLEDENETNEQSEYIRQFEEVISTTIKTAESRNRVLIEEAARRQDWKELFKFIVRTSYPQAAKVFGESWQDYEKYMEQLDVNEFGQAHSRDYLRYGDDDGVLTKVAGEMNKDRLAEAWSLKYDGKATQKDEEDIIQDTKLYEEAIELDQVLILIKEMSVRGLTPDVALTQLYGQTTVKIDSKDEKKIRLNSKLPILTI